MKNNNKGQVFVCFVIVLPLILLLVMVFIYKTLNYYEKNKIDNLLKIACESKNIEEIVKKNDPRINLKIDITSGKIILEARKEIYNNSIVVKRVCEE